MGMGIRKIKETDLTPTMRTTRSSRRTATSQKPLSPSIPLEARKGQRRAGKRKTITGSFTSSAAPDQGADVDEQQNSRTAARIRTSPKNIRSSMSNAGVSSLTTRPQRNTTPRNRSSASQATISPSTGVKTKRERAKNRKAVVTSPKLTTSIRPKGNISPSKRATKLTAKGASASASRKLKVARMSNRKKVLITSVSKTVGTRKKPRATDDSKGHPSLMVTKKRKREDTEAEKSPPPPAAPSAKKVKKPRKGDLSPKSFVTEYLVDPTFEQLIPIPFISAAFQSKLLIRAVLRRDAKLLQKLIHDRKSISSFCIPRSVQIERDALSYAIETGNVPAMKLLLPKSKPEDLAPNPQWLLQEDATGRGSRFQFGHAIRNVTVGRGGKEGNAALLKDRNIFGVDTANETFMSHHIQEAMEYGLPYSTQEKMKALLKTEDQEYFVRIQLNQICAAVRKGHNELAAQLIGIAIAKGGYGFNNLHQEALIKSKKSPLTPFKSQSVGKMSLGNNRICPVHCAAVNPDPFILSTLLSSSPLYTVLDGNHWSVVHYAAACTSPGPLEWLVSKGVSTNQVNKEGNTPAHIASENGRWRNLEIILKAENRVAPQEVAGDEQEEPKAKVATDAFSATRLNKKGFSPLHTACLHGKLEVVKILVSCPLVDKNKATPAQYDKLTPLMIAAGHGHMDVVKYLIESGAKLQIRDRRGNTALTHAVINGHAHIVSHLLRIGDNHLVKDSSGNSLVMYASAYGWYFNLMLLLEAGCCPNEPNMWKLSPLAAAFLKGQIGLVEILLKQPGVNIDAPIDSKGLTLLLQTASSLPSADVVSRLKYLIEEQKADCGIADFEQNNVIHYLVKSEADAQQKLKQDKERGWEVEEPQADYTLEALRLLVKAGAKLEARNLAQETPISVALTRGCFQVVQQLVELGGVLTSEPNAAGDTLLHLLTPHLTEEDPSIPAFYQNSAQNPKNLETMKDMCKMYNKLGMTVLLQTLHQYPILNSPDKAVRVTEFINFLVFKLDSDVNAAVREVVGGEMKIGNSVLHLSSGLNYSEEVLRIILAKEPNMDPLNGDFRTPLCTSILKRTQTAIRILMEHGANVNFISEKDGEKNMILLEASQKPNTFELIPLFVQKGAVVKDIVDKFTGNSVLHNLCKNPTAGFVVDAIKAVLKAGAETNCVNKYSRTSLHLCCNSRKGATDDSYEVEDVLIEAGARLKLKDANGRTPLHFSFLKIGKENKKKQASSNSFMDPIELVTLLTSAMKERKLESDIEAADEFGQTPLHLAAIRGSTISASHLLGESPNPHQLLNRPDKNGNTPFALAVLNNHEGSALMFLQAGADFLIELSTGFSKSLKDEAVAGSWIWIPVKQEGERLDRKNSTLCKHSILQEIVHRDWQGLLYLMLEKLKASGSGVTPGIEAALKTRRLKLAAKLMDRVKTNEQLITKKQSLLHTLAQNAPGDDQHTWPVQTRILETLVRKKADVNSLDSQKSTPLIYAAIELNSHLCSQLTDLMNIRQIPHLKADFLGRTPFSALFWNPIPTNVEFPQGLKAWAERLLFSGGEGNVLCQYPILIPKFPGIRYIPQEARDSNYFMTSITSHYSPLIMAVIYGNKNMVKWLLGLQGKIDINFPDSGGRTALMHAVRLNDIRMVKILLNPTGYDFEKDKTPWDNGGTAETRQGKPTKASVTPKGVTTSGIDLNAVDKENGWSVIHHLVAPLSSSTSLIYARSDAILKVLATAGARLDIQSREGETPLEMALRQRKFPLARSLALFLGPEIAGTVEKKIGAEVEYEVMPRINDDIPGIPPETAQKDAKEMLLQLKSKLAINEEELVVEPDPLTDFTAENSIVVMDEARKVPFDCLLNQVDLSYGIFGLYNFYKMQLIKQTKGPNLIVLFTRWGRMGDTGQYQKTPFPTEEEGIGEFKKIFKAKSGNVWDDISTTPFVPHPKKYKLVSLDRGSFSKINPKYSETVKINFVDLEKRGGAQVTHLPDDVFQLMQHLSLEHRTKSGESDSLTEILPFGQISHETLLRAEEILDQIDKLLIKESGRKDKSSGVTAPLGESVLKLSEEYFTLIPLHGYAFERITPFAQISELRKNQELIRNFLHNEFAFQLLLAAQLNQGVRNPFDYIYSALGTKIQILDQFSEEGQLILEYIYNTSRYPSRPIVEKIYRVQIPGAEEQLNQTAVGNRHLLWHGTRTCNLLSILHRGLQITPLGYTFNGSLFGKGIYFADMFEKSVKYTATAEPGRPKFAVLCEVALGEIQDVEMGYWVTQQQEGLKPGKNSLKTSNSRWIPEPSADVFWNGRRIPLGQKTENILPEDDEGKSQHGLDYNEYIIFKPEQANIKYLVQFNGSFPDIQLKSLFS